MPDAGVAEPAGQCAQTAVRSNDLVHPSTLAWSIGLGPTATDGQYDDSVLLTEGTFGCVQWEAVGDGA